MKANIEAAVPFDHNSPEHGPESKQLYQDFRGRCPVAWSENYGGFWILTRYSEIVEVFRDPETFSSAKYTDRDGVDHGGVTIPIRHHVPALLPTETDPPLWTDYRRLLARHFSRDGVEPLRPMFRKVTTRFIDRVIESGKCDLTLDVGNPITASTIINVLEIPSADWEFYAKPLHDNIGAARDSVDYANAVKGIDEIMLRLREIVEQRRKNLGDDLVSHILNGSIGGRPISDEDATKVVFQLLSGGVETTTTFLGGAFTYLSRNPDERRQLAQDWARLPLTIEEFMRVNSPVQLLCRNVMKPVTIGGQSMVPGDRVLIAMASANCDETAFEAADSFVADRYPNPHLGWGVGIHRCLGQHFARAQIEVVLREVLTRMPDYVVDECAIEHYSVRGVIDGWNSIPASFTPGPKIGGS